MVDNGDGSEHDGDGVHGVRNEVDDEDEGRAGGWRHKEEHEVEMAEHDGDANKYELLFVGSFAFILGALAPRQNHRPAIFLQSFIIHRNLLDPSLNTSLSE
ncbi:unnamed protein product [Taenia asiatica]|uniref:Transmembrane protein n=1 Tax=Taenia asiatica TaxID=60517 RepID=A0A0R3WHD5_TAEAS|nr:unnamed protein product [Taenia asiatica]